MKTRVKYNKQYLISLNLYFHTELETSDEVRNMIKHFHHTMISQLRWVETVHMSRQKSQPMAPSSWLSMDSIIFENKEVAASLQETKDYNIQQKVTYYQASDRFRKRINHKIELKFIGRYIHCCKTCHGYIRCFTLFIVILKIKITV